jgi:SNF2 family DNA or RNA helicase
MPKRINKVKVVKASAAIAEYYNKIIEAMENLSFGKVKFKELESQYMRLRQLSSGFMTLRGDDKSKTEVQFPENPKLDAMEEIISSMPETSKAIIFHDFRFTNKIISDRLKQMKVPHARVWGGAKDSLKELRKFKKDPKCRVLVINCQAGSSSQNLQMANYVIYYEQPRSSIDRQQSERRAYRPGQKKRVFFFDLIMEGTTDESQAKSNEEGRNLLQRVLDGKTKFKRLVIGA